MNSPLKLKYGSLFLKFIFLVSPFLIPVSAFAETDMSGFLKSCGYGALGGAGAGVMSLAFVDKPSEQLNNISKGASLGLYFGIGYGLYKVYGAPESKSNYDYQLFFRPQKGEKDLIPYASFSYRFQ